MSNKIALSLILIAVLGILTIAISVNNRINELETLLRKTTDRTVLGDYQLQVEQDSIVVWDADRIVGVLPFKYDEEPLSTMIMDDNQ